MASQARRRKPDAHMQRLDLEARKSARVRHFGRSSQSHVFCIWYATDAPSQAAASAPPDGARSCSKGSSPMHKSRSSHFPSCFPTSQSLDRGERGRPVSTGSGRRKTSWRSNEMATQHAPEFARERLARLVTAHRDDPLGTQSAWRRAHRAGRRCRRRRLTGEGIGEHWPAERPAVQAVHCDRRFGRLRIGAGLTGGRIDSSE